MNERPQGLKAEEGGPDNRRRVRTAVIAVPDAETTRVMLGASLGEIRLSLRGAAQTGAGAVETTATQETPPDKIVTAAELGQLKQKLAASSKPKEEERPKVTVYRGSEVHQVTP